MNGNQYLREWVRLKDIRLYKLNNINANALKTLILNSVIRHRGIHKFLRKFWRKGILLVYLRKFARQTSVCAQTSPLGKSNLVNSRTLRTNGNSLSEFTPAQGVDSSFVFSFLEVLPEPDFRKVWMPESTPPFWFVVRSCLTDSMYAI